MNERIEAAAERVRRVNVASSEVSLCEIYPRDPDRTPFEQLLEDRRILADAYLAQLTAAKSDAAAVDEAALITEPFLASHPQFHYDSSKGEYWSAIQGRIRVQFDTNDGTPKVQLFFGVFGDRMTLHEVTTIGQLGYLLHALNIPTPNLETKGE